MIEEFCHLVNYDFVQLLINLEKVDLIFRKTFEICYERNTTQPVY